MKSIIYVFITFNVFIILWFSCSNKHDGLASIKKLQLTTNITSVLLNNSNNDWFDGCLKDHNKNLYKFILTHHNIKDFTDVSLHKVKEINSLVNSCNNVNNI